MTIREIIKTRLKYTGVTQADFAKSLDVTPAMINSFFKGKTAINSNTLELMLRQTGINLDIYTNRFSFAEELAKELASKNIQPEQVVNLSKEELVQLTGRQEVLYFLDVNQSEMESIMDSQLIDPEGTLPFLKAQIVFAMSLHGKEATPKTVNESWRDLALSSLSTIGIATIAGAILAKALGSFISFQAMSKDNRLQGNLLAALYHLSKSFIK